MTTFETKSGIEIELKPVGELTLLKYFIDIGGVELANNTSKLGDYVKDLDTAGQISFMEKFTGLVAYACGFGVDRKLTDEDKDTLEHFGQAHKNKFIALSNWVWLIACEGDTNDLIKLLSEVSSISKAKEETNEAE